MPELHDLIAGTKCTSAAGKPRKRRIPEFKSVQEEAAWWDTHDITDYLDETTPVELVFKQRPAPRPVVVPLDPDGFAALEAKAKEPGVSATTLAKEWIVERLRSAQHLPGENLYRSVA